MQRLAIDARFDAHTRAVREPDLHRAVRRRAGRISLWLDTLSFSAGASFAAARSGSMRRTGTNVGLSSPFGDDAIDTRLPAPQRRSRQLSRERRIHLKTRFALTPFARATPATEAPGARAESTIRCRSATLRERRFARAPSASAAESTPPRSRRRRHQVSTKSKVDI